MHTLFIFPLHRRLIRCHLHQIQIPHRSYILIRLSSLPELSKSRVTSRRNGMEVWHVCKFINWFTAALSLTLSLALTIDVKVLRKIIVCLDNIFLLVIKIWHWKYFRCWSNDKFYLRDLSGIGYSQRRDSMISKSCCMYTRDGAIRFLNLERNEFMVAEL